jgi:hypothetical protein
MLTAIGICEFWADTNADGTINVFRNSDGHGPFQLAIASPEPTTWAMMLVGFGALGLAAHHQRRKTVAALRLLSQECAGKEACDYQREPDLRARQNSVP